MTQDTSIASHVTETGDEASIHGRRALGAWREAPILHV